MAAWLITLPLVAEPALDLGEYLYVMDSHDYFQGALQGDTGAARVATGWGLLVIGGLLTATISFTGSLFVIARLVHHWRGTAWRRAATVLACLYLGCVLCLKYGCQVSLTEVLTSGQVLAVCAQQRCVEQLRFVAIPLAGGFWLFYQAELSLLKQLHRIW
jgi:hypothetical protein